MAGRHAAVRAPVDPVAEGGEPGSVPSWASPIRPHAPARADFHCHTTRSDGLLTPLRLVADAAAAGIRVLAITDHDTVDGCREVLAGPGSVLPRGLALVPGVEINALTRGLGLTEGELHLIGLGVDLDDERFEASLAAQRSARRTRFAATLERLREIGLGVDAQVAELDLSRDDALGRPTIARCLVAAGFATSVDDAFARIIGAGRPGYVERTGLGPIEAIEAIRAAGGLPILAHFPEAPDRLDLLRELTAAGLAGIETHHRSFDARTRRRMLRVVRTLGLLPSGGTDYHGDFGPYADDAARLVLPAVIARTVTAALDPGRIHRAAGVR